MVSTLCAKSPDVAVCSKISIILSQNVNYVDVAVSLLRIAQAAWSNLILFFFPPTLCLSLRHSIVTFGQNEKS